MTSTYLLFVFGLTCLAAFYDLFRRGIAAEADEALSEEELARIDGEFADIERALGQHAEALTKVSDSVDALREHVRISQDALAHTLADTGPSKAFEANVKAEFSAVNEALRLQREIIQKQGTALQSVQASRLGLPRGTR